MAEIIEGYCTNQHLQSIQCRIATLAEEYYDNLAKGSKCSKDTLEKLTLAVALFQLNLCDILPKKYPNLLYAGVNSDNMYLSNNDAAWVSATTNGGFLLTQDTPVGDDSSIEFTVEFTSANLSTKVGLIDKTDLAEFSATADYTLLAYYLLFDSSGNVDLFKDGTTSVSANVTTYVTGDKFKLAIDDDYVLKVYKNGTLIYTWDTLDEDDIYIFGASFNNSTRFEVNDVTVTFDSSPTTLRCGRAGTDVCTLIDYLYKLTN